MMMTLILFLFLQHDKAFAKDSETVIAVKSELYAKVQTLNQKKKYDDAISLLQSELKKDLKAEDKRLVEFTLGNTYFEKGDDVEAAKVFEEFTKKSGALEEYARYYLGKSYMRTKKNELAQKEFEKVLTLVPNAKLRIETQTLLGQLLIQEKKFKQAKAFLVKLERSTRSSEPYPEVIYYLAIAEKGLRSHKAQCNWVTKLYSRYPTYSKVADWSADLASNELDSAPTDCEASPEDFRSRLRNLLWAGLDQKAQAEINTVKNKLAKTDKYLADQLQAQYFMQEGEVVKALDILKPYHESMKKNFSYLMLFGSAAARGGEVQMAVGSYYSAYKLNPRSTLARQALYQSAFLSYQFQDYDGAGRRFQEFMKVYPTSGLNRDAKWHLAWLKYLKGDYDGAYKAFSSLQTQKKISKKVWKTFPTDRISYWMGMSRFRQGQYDRAKAYFEGLAKDKSIGYYSIAAQARLKKITALEAQLAAAQKATPKVTFVAPRSISRFLASQFMMPSVEEEFRGEESESEETLVANQYDESAVEESEESEVADNPDLKTVEVAQEESVNIFPAGMLSRKLSQARDLINLGMGEWARWDLYDIESKTSNREYLKSLLSEYNVVGSYHRSSYIAQIQFGPQRLSQGFDAGKMYWEYAYPKAYEEYVNKFSKSFSVKPELVWGIMRAESQYRRDAISPVGALGLMQVMPSTGGKVATILGDKSFDAPKLLEPETAIRIGSRYLKRLGDRFEDTIPLVAAGYNAGPHRVKNWLVHFGTLDTDEFIEHIPFLETRNYVKRVMSNAQIYSQLYGSKADLFPYLADAVPVKIEKALHSKENWDDI